MWGSTYVVTTELLPSDRPLLAATARALGAGAVLMALSRRLPTGSWWWRSAVLGVLNVGGFLALLFVAAEHLPGGLAAVITSSQPLLVLAMTPWVLRQAVRGWQVACAAVGLTGVAVLVVSAGAQLDTVGVLAAVGAAVFSASGLVLTRRWGAPVGLVTFTGWQLTWGGLALLPVLLLAEGLPHSLGAPAAVGLLWLVGPSTIGGYLLWFDGIGRLPASAVAGLGMLSPLMAATLGWIVLDQAMSPLQLAGIAVALAGILGLQRTSPISLPSAVAAMTAVVSRRTGRRPCPAAVARAAA